MWQYSRELLLSNFSYVHIIFEKTRGQIPLEPSLLKQKIQDKEVYWAITIRNDKFEFFCNTYIFSCQPVKNLDQEPCLDTILTKTGFKIQGVFKTHDSVFNERSAQAEINISPNAVPDFQIFIEIKYLMPIQ